MPAAPPTAQPWADATGSVNAGISKGMRMAQAKAIVLATHWLRSFSNPCQRNRRLSSTPGRAQLRGRKGCSVRRESSNSWQWQRDQVVRLSTNTNCTEGFEQEVKGGARQPAGSRSACTPAPSVLQAVSSGLYHTRAVGQWVVILLMAWHMQQEQDAA
jgi:hypothetical protein